MNCWSWGQQFFCDHRWRFFRIPRLDGDFLGGNLLEAFFGGGSWKKSMATTNSAPFQAPFRRKRGVVSTLSKLPSLLRITVPKLHSLKMFKASASRFFFITLLLLPQHREQTESFAKTVRTCSSCGYIRKQGIPQTHNMTPLTFRGGQLLIHPHPSNFFVAQVFCPHFLASWRVYHSNL